MFCRWTLWDRLESIAWQEAAQISKNRLHERVELALDLQDALYQRVLGMDCRDLGAMAQVILPAADDNGNLSFVRDVCDAVVMVGEGAAREVGCRWRGEQALKKQNKNYD